MWAQVHPACVVQVVSSCGCAAMHTFRCCHLSRAVSVLEAVKVSWVGREGA